MMLRKRHLYDQPMMCLMQYPLTTKEIHHVDQTRSY
jgi:hypothetical protein